MTKKRILFAIGGVGLGNATRCHAILQELQGCEVEVDVFTSARAFEYFTEIEGVKELYPAVALEYGGAEGGISIKKTVTQLPTYLGQIYSNFQFLKKLFKRQKYDLLVADSEYSSMLAARYFSIPLLAINQSNTIVFNIGLLKKLPKQAYGQWVVECFDWVFHRFFAQWIISPSLIAPEVMAEGRMLTVPSIVRKHLEGEVRLSNSFHVVVCPSGSQYALEQKEFGSLVAKKEVQWTFLGKGAALERGLEAFSSADLVVIQGGLSSVTEALKLQKPCVIVPVENHAEQFYNASFVESLGVGVIANRKNMALKLAGIIANISEYKKRAEKILFPSTGARVVAELIQRILLTGEEKLGLLK